VYSRSSEKYMIEDDELNEVKSMMPVEMTQQLNKVQTQRQEVELHTERETDEEKLTMSATEKGRDDETKNERKTDGSKTEATTTQPSDSQTERCSQTLEFSRSHGLQ